jgi:hypothetical protein
MLRFLVVLMQGSVVGRRSPTVVREWEAKAVWRVGPGRLVKADAGGRSIVFGPHPCVRRRAAWATASTKNYRDGPVSHEIAIYTRSHALSVSPKSRLRVLSHHLTVSLSGAASIPHESCCQTRPQHPDHAHVPLHPNINYAVHHQMETVSVPVSAGLPSPRSPTLSIASMILPENTLRSISPPPHLERPPSPPSGLYSHSNKSASTIRLATAPQRRQVSPQEKSPPLSSRSSRSTIRTMGSSDGSSKKSGASPPRNNDALASSPTIADAAFTTRTPNEWDEQRRFSNASSSVHSEDLENLKWPGFGGNSSFDDSGVMLGDDEDEERDHFPGDASGDPEADNDRWLDGQSEAGEEYSSAALSRRAEQILANAKKRLNVSNAGEGITYCGSTLTVPGHGRKS